MSLRHEAAKLEAQGTLLCLPVGITASTCASASSLNQTANGTSLVKDMHLSPLTGDQMQTLVISLAKRSSSTIPTPLQLPDKLVLLLHLTGGNPDMVAQAVCLSAGCAEAPYLTLPAGYVMHLTAARLACACVPAMSEWHAQPSLTFFTTHV